MKAIKRTIIFIAVMIFIQLYSTSIPEEKIPEGDYIYSKAFDNEVINVILDTVTVSKKKAIEMGWSAEFIDEQKGDKVLVEYPKMIEEQISTENYQDIRRFKLLNPDGNILLEREYNHNKERYYTSKDKKYIVFSEMPDEYKLELQTTFYNNKGKILWEKESWHYFTTILNNGISIGGYGAYYNKKGEKIGIRPEILPYPEFISIGVMDDNNIFYSFRWYGSKSIVMVTDSMGNEKWRKELPYKFASPNEYDIDPEIGIVGIYDKYIKTERVFIEKLGKYINHEMYKYGIDLINSNGELIFHYPMKIIGNKRIKISSDKSAIYVYSSKFDLSKIDLISNEILWSAIDSTEKEKKEYKLNNIIEDDNVLYVDYVNRGKWNSTKIVEYNKSSGNKIQKTIFQNNRVKIIAGKYGTYLYNIENKKLELKGNQK